MPNVPDRRVPAAFIVVQRDEGELLRAWVAHHARLMPECIVIVDDGSADGKTRSVLQEAAARESVQVIRIESAAFDQERCVELGIHLIQEQYPAVRWLFSLDVDEFVTVPDSLSALVNSLDVHGVVYASAPHINAVPELSSSRTAKCEPWYLGTTQYYHPWRERPWQEEGHLRKAFCRIHESMRFAVGNHYVFHDRLVSAFPGAPYTPVPLGQAQIALRHFEMRDCGEQLLRKLSNLTHRQIVPGADSSAPWWERNRRLDQLHRSYVGRPKELYEELVVRGPRTLWGTMVPQERMLQMEPLT
jgi:hypothetical protein